MQELNKIILKSVIFITIVTITFLGIYACDETSTSPPIPPPTTTTTIVIPDPPHDPGVDFSWNNTRGILVFPGTQATTAQIQALDNRLHMASWPLVTYNVCSETTDWRQTPWAVGPPAFSKENLDNLRNFLKTTAALGSQVKLNIFCTLRDNIAWMDENAKRYTTIISKIAKDYNHINLSIANEPYHSGSWFKDKMGRMRMVRDTARLAGFQGPMGADDNIGCPGCSFEYQYRKLGFVPEFHPYRNPDPSRNALRRIVAVNGLPVVISEPTAYSSWREGRCCTSNREAILRYMRDAEDAGITWFFHSTDGLMWPALIINFEWIPRD